MNWTMAQKQGLKWCTHCLDWVKPTADNPLRCSECNWRLRNYPQNGDSRAAYKALIHEPKVGMVAFNLQRRPPRG